MSESATRVIAAARRLRDGGLVAFPTETVYGLGADALNPAAVARVFEIKGRPSANPLIVHVSGHEMARRLALAWPDHAERLARAFWPGPLSIIVSKAPHVPDLVTAGGSTVALRCPDHPLALALLFEFGGPLVGPSANRSGELSPTRAEHVTRVFPDDLVMTLDGGPCAAGIESTVLRLDGDRGATVLRPGVIGPAEISRVLGLPVTMGTDPAPHAILESPGLLISHYAPQTPARLVTPHDLARLSAGEPASIVLARSLTRVEPPHRLVPMPADAAPYAAALYEALHRADRAGAAQILIETPPPSDGTPEGEIWAAIADRLRRATAKESAGTADNPGVT